MRRRHWGWWQRQDGCGSVDAESAFRFVEGDRGCLALSVNRLAEVHQVEGVVEEFPQRDVLLVGENDELGLAVLSQDFRVKLHRRALVLSRFRQSYAFAR